MASLLALDRRIKAAKNVSRTTKAMQMIAASKLKRAQSAVVASRPYVEKLSELVGNLATKTDEKNMHPYMESHSVSNKTLLLAISPDKGLCGSLITNLIKEYLQYKHMHADTQYITVGKKIETQVTKFQNEVVASFVFGTTTPTYDTVYPISKLIDDYYLSGKVSSVKVLYTRFASVFSQKPTITNLLPISIPQEDPKAMREYIFEPHAQEILKPLLKNYMETTLYQYLLESYVSEQASKMIAMQNATDNANDIISDLRLEYNKTRQARITSEILDITNTGAK